MSATKLLLHTVSSVHVTFVGGSLAENNLTERRVSLQLRLSCVRYLIIVLGLALNFAEVQTYH